MNSKLSVQHISHAGATGWVVAGIGRVTNGLSNFCVSLGIFPGTNFTSKVWRDLRLAHNITHGVDPSFEIL